MGCDEPDDSGNQKDLNAKVEALEDGFEARISVPAITKLHADPCQRVAPGPRTDEGVEVKAELVHLRHSGGEGDEGAHDGQHAADEDGDGAEAVEEAVDAVEIVAAEEKIAAVALNHGATAA